MPHSIDELRQMIVSARIPSHVRQIAHRELEILSEKTPDTDEYIKEISYIDYLISLPWNKKTENNSDLEAAEKVFNEKCRDSKKIGTEIFEYMAAHMFKENKVRRVLVVDDEKIALRNMEHALKKEDYMVVAANSGAEALEKLEESEFDVIITDLIMGEIDGHAVLEKTKNRYPDAKVIMITGYATVDTAVEAIRKGAFHYIEKPIRLNEVRSAVKEALRQKCLSEATKGSALCFAGPAGSGKTSLGMAVAEALGRKFIEVSLNNVSDLSDIMGRKRTDEGARPGCIIEGVRQAGVSNPVILLNEEDKVGQDINGKLLTEIFNSGQNCNYIDHYVDVPFDLADVMFIVTLNSVNDIPGSLKEVLKIIEL